MSEQTPAARLWAVMRCPACGTPPDPTRDHCTRCARLSRAPEGALDMMLTDDRLAADRFLAAYVPLRRSEGWADNRGVEDPDHGGRRHWRTRRRAAVRASRVLRDKIGPRRPALIADVGAGGGWLARLLPFAAVAALDLGEPPVSGGADVRVRADMLRLPFVDGSLDAAVYCASLHYAPLQAVLDEASRVLRPGGILLCLETPIYTDEASAAAAAARSAAYFEAVGAPVLSERYNPPALGPLRQGLARTGFEIERLDGAHSRYGALRMMRGSRAFPFLVARKSGSDLIS